MTDVFIRNTIGLLVQIVPCAVLCLLPFEGRFRAGARRAWLRAAAIIALELVPFLLVATLEPPAMAQDWVSTRKTLQNLAFLAIVAALLALHAHEVDAERAHRGFVFSLVMLYGFLVTLTSSNVSALLPPSARADDYLYAPRFLMVLTAVNAALLAAMMPVMQALRQAFAARISTSIWWRMTALLALLTVTLLVGGWLPPLGFEGLYFSLSLVITADSIVLIWWLLRMVRDASVQADRERMLKEALKARLREREALSDELEQVRERVAELERQAAPDAEETPVVLSTPAQAVSFLPDDITYVDSLNRVRAIHFADGESIQMNMTLAQIAGALPAGRFAYCHRSIVVNLRHVRSMGAGELTLDDGTTLPVSRRRAAELREALSSI